MEEIDQTINGSIKRYDEVIKVSTGQGDDCARDVYQIMHISKTIAD